MDDRPADLVGHPGGWLLRRNDQLVPESRRSLVTTAGLARSGVRFFHDDGPLHDGYAQSAMVFLDRDITFTVEDEAEHAPTRGHAVHRGRGRPAFGEWRR